MFKCLHVQLALAHVADQRDGQLWLAWHETQGGRPGGRRRHAGSRGTGDVIDRPHLAAWRGPLFAAFWLRREIRGDQVGACGVNSLVDPTRWEAEEGVSKMESQAAKMLRQSRPVFCAWPGLAPLPRWRDPRGKLGREGREGFIHPRNSSEADIETVALDDYFWGLARTVSTQQGGTDTYGQAPETRGSERERGRESLRCQPCPSGTCLVRDPDPSCPLNCLGFTRPAHSALALAISPCCI